MRELQSVQALSGRDAARQSGSESSVNQDEKMPLLA
jgi:hypothetical protein